MLYVGDTVMTKPLWKGHLQMSDGMLWNNKFLDLLLAIIPAHPQPLPAPRPAKALLALDL